MENFNCTLDVTDINGKSMLNEKGELTQFNKQAYLQFKPNRDAVTTGELGDQYLTSSAKDGAFLPGNQKTTLTRPLFGQAKPIQLPQSVNGNVAIAVKVYPIEKSGSNPMNSIGVGSKGEPTTKQKCQVGNPKSINVKWAASVIAAANQQAAQHKAAAGRYSSR